MWNDFMFSVGAILPVFGVMVLGFLLRRRGFLTQGFCQTGNRLVFNLCLPAMLLRQIASMGGVRAADGGFLLYAFAATLAGVLAVWLPAHFFMKDKTQVGAFAQGAFRGNTALLGAALLQSICGSQAYAPLIILAAVPVYNVLSVVVLSLEAGGGGTLDRTRVLGALKQVARNPILLGILAGMPFALTGRSIPLPADKVLSMLGGLASPLSLLVIGAGFRWQAALEKRRTTLLAALVKLVLLPAAALPPAAALGFRGEALVALLVMSGTPSAVSSYIMAENMGNDGVLANGIVAVTTLLSAVTLTGWIFLLRTLQLI
ncbi:MAG: AEC family transporter [Clostridia bacterium]|nr:AEC family transporter [Clostridia bacterium]